MKKIFFLGGYDLEMITIKNILEKHNINFIDKKLSWGAKLSDYKDELEKYKDWTIYGIELEKDINPPNNYIEIDHHNTNDFKPSSLEQVANILDIILSREEKLICANDSNYIKGMEKLGASKAEIEHIRQKDREAQGVTKEDENLAEKSLQKAKDNIIYAYTNTFSPISDKAYFKYKNYIIYNGEEIVFYGYQKEFILDFLSKQNIPNDAIYYGGGELGFVGIKQNLFSKKILKLIENFKFYEKNFRTF